MTHRTKDLILALLQREKKVAFLPFYNPERLEEINQALKEIQKL